MNSNIIRSAVSKKTVNSDKTDFFKGLRNEVFAYLKENHLSQIDQKGLLKKALICYSMWFVSYLFFLAVGYYYSWNALWAVLPMMFSLTCIVLAVMHDGSHGSFSKSKALNSLAAYSLGFAGASSLIWHKLHVRAHHDTTNVIGYDQDFESGGLIRLHPAQVMKKAFRFQHLYAWFLYMGHSLRWILYDDIHDYFTNRWEFNTAERRKLLYELLIVKTWHVGVYFVIPALVIGWQIALVSYLIHWMVLSLAMILIFAMAHLTEVQDMPSDKGKYPDWALHQLATTTDFAPNNRILSWIIGGLNFQVEHHIFPKISHTRYPEIQKVIKKYCLEHKIKFLEYPTFTSVVRAHFHHLRNLGTVKV